MISAIWMDGGAMFVREGDVLHVIREPRDKYKLTLARLTELQALLVLLFGIRLA